MSELGVHAKRDTITISLCTHPPRLHLLKKSIPLLLPQASRINVYLNEVDIVPAWLHHEKINAVRSQDTAGNLGSHGKFYWAQTTSGYHLIVDDDILYPHDYAEQMCRNIDQYDRQAMVCVHGHIFLEHMRNYYFSKQTIHFEDGLTEDVQVHAAGNGTLAFHSDIGPLSVDIFTHSHMDDVHLGVYCKQKCIPIYAVMRPRYWLRATGYDNIRATAKWQRFFHNDELVRLIRQNTPWSKLFIPTSAHQKRTYTQRLQMYAQILAGCCNRK